MKQYEAVIQTLEKLGGIATIGQINHHIFEIKDCEWNLEKLSKDIQKILEEKVEYFYKALPGLYGLLKYKEKNQSIKREKRKRNKFSKEIISKKIDYVPTINFPDFEGNPKYKLAFIPKLKVEINTIKIDKTKFAFNNPIYEEKIEDIVYGFDLDFWDPIYLSEDDFLLDGQHRLKACEMLGIKFIDVLINK